MKKFKKIMAVLVAAMMIMATMVPAWAATITINRDTTFETGATGARTYNAYKILDASYTSLTGVNAEGTENNFTYTPDGAPVAYTMTTDSPWLTQIRALTTYFNVALAADGSVYVVTPKTAFNTASAAASVAETLASSIPSNATSIPLTTPGSTTVDAGYYLIIPSDGATKLTLVTTDVTIYEKNSYLVTTKTATEQSYKIGDTVTYTTTVTIPADTKLTASGGSPVILHDIMDSSLQFGGSVSTSNLTSTDYTLNENPGDGCTFEISIPVTAAVLDKTITFTYTATILATADDDTGLVNTLYGTVNNYQTVSDSVYVYTFDIDFVKTFTGGANTLNASFELRTTANDTNTAIKFTNGVRDDANGNKTITATNGTAVELNGLAAGTYYLVETATATGYNKLTDPITITINDTTTTDKANPTHTVSYSGAGVTAASDASDETVITVVNDHGAVLPSTGGMGTTVLYIVGGMLVILAGAYLFFSRKRTA